MSIRAPEFPDEYFTDEYKTLIRTNEDFLKSKCQSIPIISKDWLYANRNDFYQFIVNHPEYTFNKELVWTYAFLNDIDDPHQDISHLTEFLIIDIEIIKKLIKRNNTKFDQIKK